jgi:hypothetical protein
VGGAILKTEAGGEIDALDPGGYGGVTITKSITIDGGGGQVASTLVAGTNGIVVVAGSSDHVILRNIRFEGLAWNGSNLPGAGINGVSFLSGGSLRLEDDAVSGFAHNGVLDTNSAASRLVVSNSAIDDNFGDGLLVAPGAGGSARGVLENVALENDACGLAVTTLGAGTGTCGTGAGGVVATSASVTAFSRSLSANSTDGVFSSGGGSNAFVGNDLITANSLGLDPQSSGQLTTLCGDYIGGNSTDGSPTSAVAANCGAGGPAGAVGPSGPAGVTGATGPTGPAGARGAAGKVELVTCRQVKVHRRTRARCTAKLVPAAIRFTIFGKLVGATLTHGGRSYASGTVTIARHREVGLMSLRRNLQPGRYSLNLYLNGRLSARRTIMIR